MLTFQKFCLWDSKYYVWCNQAYNTVGSKEKDIGEVSLYRGGCLWLVYKNSCLNSVLKTLMQ